MIGVYPRSSAASSLALASLPTLASWRSPWPGLSARAATRTILLMNPTVTDATEGAPDPVTRRASPNGPAAAHSGRSVIVRIRRQDAPDKPDTARWEEFAVPHRPNMNVIS